MNKVKVLKEQLEKLSGKKVILKESRLVLRRGDSVLANKNLRWEGQTIPSGAIGKVVDVQLTAAHEDIYVIDFGKDLGEFDFYPRDFKYLTRV
jgi:hypothetical protein